MQQVWYEFSLYFKTFDMMQLYTSTSEADGVTTYLLTEEWSDSVLSLLEGKITRMSII